MHYQIEQSSKECWAMVGQQVQSGFACIIKNHPTIVVSVLIVLQSWRDLRPWVSYALKDSELQKQENM